MSVLDFRCDHLRARVGVSDPDHMSTWPLGPGARHPTTAADIDDRYRSSTCEDRCPEDVSWIPGQPRWRRIRAGQPRTTVHRAVWCLIWHHPFRLACS